MKEGTTAQPSNFAFHPNVLRVGVLRTYSRKENVLSRRAAGGEGCTCHYVCTAVLTFGAGCRRDGLPCSDLGRKIKCFSVITRQKLDLRRDISFLFIADLFHYLETCRVMFSFKHSEEQNPRPGLTVVLEKALIWGKGLRMEWGGMSIELSNLAVHRSFPSVSSFKDPPKSINLTISSAL